jgi:hypothetical protein
MQERNMVWETQMLELFGQKQFEYLELNKPLHLAEASGAIDLAGSGKFIKSSASRSQTYKAC